MSSPVRVSAHGVTGLAAKMSSGPHVRPLPVAPASADGRRSALLAATAASTAAPNISPNATAARIVDKDAFPIRKPFACHQATELRRRGKGGEGGERGD